MEVSTMLFYAAGLAAIAYLINHTRKQLTQGCSDCPSCPINGACPSRKPGERKA